MNNKPQGKPGKPCQPATVQAIENLRSALVSEFGCDFSFVVAGNGHLLGASAMQAGIIIATPIGAPAQALTAEQSESDAQASAARKAPKGWESV